ncbi:glucan endo-1,3-beta-glucosidase 3-like isoform X4 [Canna indica]|uniref:Glucan endo-1,3-beta-glucosidase 3-like isoform X4 n=1 Tax=Canna indica TaxID=4628 RepID=A0AAQ3JYC2_9LILI|nr:glucan endo-1,3-beta-glucosidase 3-like isoform X4 [Canna indica]
MHQGSANCSAIQPGQPCYEENNLVALASYAYNDYYQKAKADGGTCDFGNTGIITTIDPSHDSCIFTRSPGASKGGESPGSQPPSNMAGSDGVILWQFARAAYLFTMMLHLCIYI